MNRMKKLLITGAVVATLLTNPIVLAGAKDDPLLFMVNIDQLEKRNGDEDPVVLEAQAWAGYDLHKLWVKTEVERVDDKYEEVEWQLLYSRAISPFWNLELGVRNNSIPRPERNWSVIGLHGLAPYYFEIDSALFIGESGRSALRFEAEYELMLTQRWVVIPEFELNFYGKTDEETETGSGLANSELGLRLAYEFRREFAPYIGVNWEKKYGKTADFAEEEGESTDDTQFVIGVHIWF